MGKSSFEVKIRPEILEYAIDVSGYSKEFLAEKIKKKKKSFTLDYLKGILSGENHPLFSDLEKMDHFLKRGLPFFFLEFIPEEEKKLEYRKKDSTKGLEPKTEVTLREFNYLREEIKYFLDVEGTPIHRRIKEFSIFNNPLKVAEEFRNLFDYSRENFEKASPKEVFDYLREKIEELGAFVFKNYYQTEFLDDNLRGCIFLGNDLPPLILINSNDNKNAEIFSLLHEFAHFLLNKEEVDTIELTGDIQNKVEVWCNEFAFSFLISYEDSREEEFEKKNKDLLIAPDNLKNLSEKYKTSKFALMFHFFRRNIISLNEFNEFKSMYKYKEKREEKKSGGGDYYATIRDKFSKKFVDLIYNSYKKGSISQNEAFNYLKVRDKSRLDYIAREADK
jgi:Zn-dependent peptidase ImmA (M78 family)